MPMGMLDLQKKFYLYLHQDYRVLQCGKNAGGNPKGMTNFGQEFSN